MHYHQRGISDLSDRVCSSIPGHKTDESSKSIYIILLSIWQSSILFFPAKEKRYFNPKGKKALAVSRRERKRASASYVRQGINIGKICCYYEGGSQQQPRWLSRPLLTPGNCFPEREKESSSRADCCQASIIRTNGLLPITSAQLPSYIACLQAARVLEISHEPRPLFYSDFLLNYARL